MEQKPVNRVSRLKFVWQLTLVVAAVAGSIFFSIRLSRYPLEQATSLRNRVAAANLPPKEQLALEKDLLAFETDNRIKIWTAIVQALGGLVVLFGLVFTWRNLKATLAKLDID